MKFLSKIKVNFLMLLTASVVVCSCTKSASDPTPASHTKEEPPVVQPTDEPPVAQPTDDKAYTPPSVLSQAKPEVLAALEGRYQEYLSFVDTLAAQHGDAYGILKEHLTRAMRAYAQEWTDKDRDNIAKMQLANLLAISNRQKDLVDNFGQKINFKDVFVPAKPFADDEDGVNIAIIDNGFNAVPLLEMDKLIAFYSYNPLSEHFELVDTDFPLPEYAYHMGRQFREVGGMDFNLGNRVRKVLNTNDPASPPWESWEQVESPLAQNLSKNVSSLTLKKNPAGFMSIVTNPYSQLANNKRFISVLEENGVILKAGTDDFRKRKLLFDHENSSHAHGAMVTSTLLQHAPRTKVVLIDLEFVDYRNYHSKEAAERAYKKIQHELEELLVQHKIQFTTRAFYTTTKFDGHFDHHIDIDRFSNPDSPRTFLEIFCGFYSFAHNGLSAFIKGNQKLVAGNFPNALVAHSFSSGCKDLPKGLRSGLSVDAFNTWKENSPAVDIFSFSSDFPSSKIITTSELFINRHVCYNFYNQQSNPSLDEYDGAYYVDEYSNAFNPQCFIHQHQACCKKRSGEDRAKFWKYCWENSERPDYEWTDYLGFSVTSVDQDVSNGKHIWGLRHRQLEGDTSSIAPVVAAWASYIKRTSFAGEARSPELFRKIKDRMTGAGKRPFQDPFAFDELPVFLDGRSGALASYRIKPGMLLPK